MEKTCSFCGRPASQCKALFGGLHGETICDECVEFLTKELAEDPPAQEEKPEEAPAAPKPLATPRELYKHLDQYVIGQELAKRTLSVAVYNHYKRLRPRDEKLTDVELQKSNILLVGPTGSGKTLLAQTLAKALDVPFAIADATTLTEAGYVGEDVENIVAKLVQAADGDIEKAQRGIIYLDEIDKIASSAATQRSSDISREGVQRDLLPIVEGSTVNTKHGMIRTDHILFIAAGAFHFSKPSDLVPELQGRFPLRVELQPLGKAEFLRILTEPDNSLQKQYSALLSTEGVELEFTQEGLEEIAAFAEETNARTENIGARRLYTMLEKILADISFHAPDCRGQKIVVDKAYVNANLEDVREDADLSRFIL